jgi:trimethylamine:corrinoid methyltransferase-like protein
VGEADVVAALDEVGPAGDFLSRTETRDAVRGGEFFMPRLGYHGTFDRWEAMSRPDAIGQAREIAWKAIDGHTPLPFADGVAEEMARLELAARG